MPQLDEILEKRKKKPFIKKEYRSWNFSGAELSSDNAASLPAKDAVNDLAQKSSHVSSAVLDEFSTPETLPSVLPVQKPTKTDNAIDNVTDNKTDNKRENTQITQRAHTDNPTKQTDNIHITNRQFKDNFKDNKVYVEMIKKLVGIQEKIFFSIVEICNIKGSLEAGIIITNDLAIAANCTHGSAKTSLQRLIDKGLIIRNPGLRCRTGHLNLAISQEVKLASVEAKRERDFMPYIRQHLLQRQDNNTDNKPSLYSSNYNINNTTKDLPDEWKGVDIEPLQHIGFSESHLKQLFSKNSNLPEIIQESINHFAYALENNPKVKQYNDPLNVLMGVLRKGQAWIESNYRSPQEIARKQLIEFKKAEQERIKKYEEEAYELAFLEWKEKLTTGEIEAITLNEEDPSNLMPKKLKLRAYFKENIWSDEKKKYLLIENK